MQVMSLPQRQGLPPHEHSQDLAREDYVAFQTQEKQRNKLQVKVVKTKTLHLIKMGKEVPHTQPALLGETENSCQP